MPLLSNENPRSVPARPALRSGQLPLNIGRRVVPAQDSSLLQSQTAARSIVSVPTPRSLPAGPVGSLNGRPALPGRSADRSLDRGLGSGLGSSLGAETQRVVCGNPVCQGRWTPPWKSRSYPFFEDKWACSPRCLLTMVRLAVAREVGDGLRDSADDGAVQHKHRIPLGLVLLAQGWINHPQLRKALEMQRLKGSGRIGDWLVSECGLRPEWVTRGLSVQWNCPVLTTEGFSPETMARTIPRAFIEEFGILPVRIAARRILYVGFQDHLDAASAFAVEQMTGLRTECGVIGEDRYRKARAAVLGCEFLEVKKVCVADRDALARSIERAIEQRKPTASRLVRLHRYYWLRLWNESETSLRPGKQVPAAREAIDHLYTIES